MAVFLLNILFGGEQEDTFFGKFTLWSKSAHKYWNKF